MSRKNYKILHLSPDPIPPRGKFSGKTSLIIYTTLGMEFNKRGLGFYYQCIKQPSARD
jgi:hypothetical protein